MMMLDKVLIFQVLPIVVEIILKTNAITNVNVTNKRKKIYYFN